jgi:hypothetical protein
MKEETFKNSGIKDTTIAIKMSLLLPSLSTVVGIWGCHFYQFYGMDPLWMIGTVEHSKM